MNEHQASNASHAPTNVNDMDSETFLAYGHRIIDWIAHYLDQIRAYPILSQAPYRSIQQSLPDNPPLQAEAMEAILQDFERILLPGITHWNAPGFMAYFASSASGPGILGELLASALNANAMLWRASPAATELEQVTTDWLRQMLGLPQTLFGIIHDTASTGTLSALAAAREAIPNLAIRSQGVFGRSDLPRLCIYASQEAHSSVEKAALLLGFGQEGIRKIPVDAQFCMNPTQLEQTIQKDLDRGFIPCAVIATVGTTSTGSIDPVAAIANICERHHIWLHVDGAYGATAAIASEKRWILEGCARADSFVVNPHKWLFVPLDCSVLYTRRPEALKAAHSLVPEYLRNISDATEEPPDLMDYSPALGRRFRALKLWMVLRYFGQEGLATRIREHNYMAQQLVAWINARPYLEILAPVHLSLVCFRFRSTATLDDVQLNTINEQILKQINARGHFFLSHTKIQGKFILRVAINHIRTTREDLAGLYNELQTCLDPHI